MLTRFGIGKSIKDNRLSWSLFILIVLICSAALFGQITGERFLAVYFFKAAMSFRSAATFMLLVFSLLPLLQKKEKTLKTNYLYIVPAFLISLYSLIENKLGYSGSIERYFLSGFSSKQFPLGQMSPSTALSGLLLSFGLWPHRQSKNNFSVFAHITTLLACSLGLFGLVGYLYGAEINGRIEFLSQMALPTSLVVVFLSLLTLITSKKTGFMTLFTTHSGVGSLIARRFLPAITMSPIAVGLITFHAQKIGLIPSWLSQVVLTFLMILLLAFIVIYTGHKIEKLDVLLKEKERIFRLVLDCMSEGVIVADDSGELIVFNPAAKSILDLKHPPEHFEDWANSYSFFHLNKKEKYKISDLPLTKALKSETTDNIEQFIKIEGELEGRFIRIGGRPLKNPKGFVVGGICVFSDITEDKIRRDNILATERLFHHLFEYSPDAVIAVNLEGVIEKINQQTERLFGYEKEELIGKNVEILIPDRYHEMHIKDRMNYSKRPEVRPMRGELLGKKKDGKEIAVAISLGPFDLGDNKIIMAAIRDVSLEKENEKRIQNLNNELKKNVKNLAIVNKELESFSYSVSHDLRSPLRAMTGFSSALLEDFGDKLEEDAKSYLVRIDKAAKKMGSLIDGLLELSRLTRKDLSASNVNLSEICEQVKNELALLDPARKIKWIIPSQIEAYCDANLINIFLRNILGNSWKFTRKKEEALIEFGLIENEENDRTYFIKDNGAGFDMKYSSKLFGAFQRLHTADEFEGTGIGLATAQRVISRHGGKVWIESEVDQGTTVYFHL